MNNLAVLTSSSFVLPRCDFEGLRGYGTLEYEGQVPIVFQASVCIASYIRHACPYTCRVYPLCDKVLMITVDLA